MRIVEVAPIGEVVSGVDPASPTQEQWDEYNAHTFEVARAALAQNPEGIELRYPSGAFDRLHLDEHDNIVAVPTDKAPVAEPDPSTAAEVTAATTKEAD